MRDRGLMWMIIAGLIVLALIAWARNRPSYYPSEYTPRIEVDAEEPMPFGQ